MTLFIFLIILTLYFHIVYHLKKSNDLDIYETIYTNKQQLENICKLRQPIIFNYSDFPSCEQHNLLSSFPNKEINVINCKSREMIPLKLSDSFELFKKAPYYSYNNQSFLEDTPILSLMKKMENDIKPIFTGKSIYDLLLGANKSYTPLQYEINYRNYFLVADGSVKIRFAPPISEKYLEPSIDYETLEAISLFNVWMNDNGTNDNLQNVKFIDIVVPKGKMVHIPPYWWFSIQFLEESSIVSFKYRTYMNILTILPQIILQILQLQNIKPTLNSFQSKIVKPFQKKKLNKATKNKLKQNIKEIINDKEIIVDKEIIFDNKIFDNKIFDNKIFDNKIFDNKIFDNKIFDKDLIELS
jgi:hypothetical protein